MDTAAAAFAPPRDHNQPPPLEKILAENYAFLAEQIEVVANAANATPKAVASDEDLAAVGEVVREARRMRAVTEQRRTQEKEPHLRAGKTVDGFFKAHLDRLDRISAAMEARATVYQREKAAEARRQAEEAARAARAEEQRQREIAARAEEANRAKAAAAAEQRAEAAAEKAAVAEAATKAAAPAIESVRGASGLVASAKTEWTFEVLDYAAIPLDALKPYLKREEIERAIRQFVRFNKGATPLAGVRIFEDVRASFR